MGGGSVQRVDGLSLGSMLAKIISIDQRQIETQSQRKVINKKRALLKFHILFLSFISTTQPGTAAQTDQSTTKGQCNDRWWDSEQY
jgi:hypothetical protein